MPTTTVAKDLSAFLKHVADLLDLVSRCRGVLFRKEFRERLEPAAREVIARLRDYSSDEFVRHPEKHKQMKVAGLAGPQLALKLESYFAAAEKFDSEGSQELLEHALGAGETILSSLAGAIPGFGSFAQEFVEFLLMELRKRFRWSWW